MRRADSVQGATVAANPQAKTPGYGGVCDQEEGWSSTDRPSMYHPSGPVVEVRRLYEKRIKLKLSGNEVYYTACSLLVIFKNSRSELQCQNDLILLSCKVQGLRFRAQGFGVWG